MIVSPPAARVALLEAPIITGVVPRDGGADVYFVPERGMSPGVVGNGTPVTVTAWPGGQRVVAGDPQDMRARFVGLTNGTEYTFTATQGTLEASEPSDPVTPRLAMVPTDPVVQRVLGRTDRWSWGGARRTTAVP